MDMPDMTISQALRRIKKLKGQIAEFQTRAVAAVTHPADQQPAFVFGACLEQVTVARDEMLRLQTAVAIANASVSVDIGGQRMLLAFAIRRLEELRGEIDWYRKLSVKAQERVTEHEQEYNGDKFVSVPKSFVCHLPEAKRAERVAELQDRFDCINDAVETMNHRTTVNVETTKA